MKNFIQNQKLPQKIYETNIKIERMSGYETTKLQYLSDELVVI